MPHTKEKIVAFPVAFAPARTRLVEPLSFERFCIADFAGEWDHRSEINGIVILQYPRCIMLNASTGCSVIRVEGTDIEQYFEEALEELDRVA